MLVQLANTKIEELTRFIKKGMHTRKWAKKNGVSIRDSS